MPGQAESNDSSSEWSIQPRPSSSDRDTLSQHASLPSAPLNTDYYDSGGQPAVDELSLAPADSSGHHTSSSEISNVIDSIEHEVSGMDRDIDPDHYVLDLDLDLDLHDQTESSDEAEVKDEMDSNGEMEIEDELVGVNNELDLDDEVGLHMELKVYISGFSTGGLVL